MKKNLTMIFRFILWGLVAFFNSIFIIAFVRSKTMIFSRAFIFNLSPGWWSVVFTSTLFLAILLYRAEKKQPFSLPEIAIVSLPCLLFAWALRANFSDLYLTCSFGGIFIVSFSLTAGLVGLRWNFSTEKIRKKITYLFYLGVFLFAIVFTHLVTVKVFNYRAYDSSLLLQAMFNTLKGHPLLVTCAPVGIQFNHFLFHFSPILIMLAPCYLIFPSIFTFFLLQVAVILIGVFPLRALAKKILRDGFVADLIAISYLASVPLSSMMLWGFREITFIIPLVLFGFYFLENKKPFLFYLCSVGAMLCKEEMLAIFILVGLYLIIFKNKKILGLALITTAVSMALVYLKAILPTINQGGYVLRPRYFGKAFNLAILLRRFFSFRNLQYFVFNFSPMLGVSWLSGGFILTFILQLLMLFLMRLDFTINNYYQGSILPFLFLAGIYGLQKFLPLQEKFKKFFLGFLLVNILLTNLLFGNHFLKFGRFPGWVWPLKERQTILKMRRLIPPEASVFVDDNFGPWLAMREKYYIYLPNNYDWDEFQLRKVKSDYIILNTKNIKTKIFLENLIAEHIWRIKFSQNDWIILEKVPVSPGKSDPLLDLPGNK